MKLKKIIALTAAMTMIIGTTVASAASVEVEGGRWTYGVGKTVYSKYYHKSKTHGSSVINGNGDMATDYNVKKGKTSSASLPATDDTDHAYYCIGKR